MSTLEQMSSLEKTPSLEEIKAMPKLEMHIHLEGTIDPVTVLNLAKKYDEPLPRPIDSLYETGDLSAFLATLDWVCSLAREAEDAVVIADNFGRYCRSQNICYVELILNPTHWSNFDYKELFPALNRAFDVVQEKYAVDVRLLPSILRQQSSEQALELVEWMGEARVERIVGLSMDGNEATAGRTGEKFAPAYARAKELGFGLTTHAGESSGPEGVRDAIELLKVDRIDHGIRVIEDEELTELLAQHGTTLNVCLKSNCTLLYPSINHHPFKKLKEKGVAMTLNTDDPIVLNTSLSEELFWASQQLSLNYKDLMEMQLQAVRSAFCDESTKNTLISKISAAN